MTFQLFQQNKLTNQETKNIKGGYFCEIYIAHCNSGHTYKSSEMRKARILDRLAKRRGADEALQRGGSEFVALYN